MHTSVTALAGMFAGTVLALSTAGIAFAAPAVPTPVPTGPSAPAAPSQPTSPAAVFVSSPSARPGTTVRVSGTCALPPSGAAPTVVSVTSPAFTGPEQFSKTDANAFDGTATIARAAVPGRYAVTLTCSNSTATTTVRVTGPDRPAGDSGHAVAAPMTPAAPVVHTIPGVRANPDPSGRLWLGIGIGALALAAAGAAPIAVARHRGRIRR
jgi:hypothetical protein